MAPELLSPARDAHTAREAILAGADSVYIGAPLFGARKDAANSAGDIADLCRFAHLYGCKVYVALNTILFDSELQKAARMAEELWDAGADAIIAQDLGLLAAAGRRVKFHASTQCHIDSPDKARFLEAAGFAAVVLARETPLRQIAETARAVNVPVECFVHGALCVSYSGQCYLSYKIGGRSGNRGECAQPCRMKYEFEDSRGRRVAPPAYYLSLRDMNRLSALGEMLDAGVGIFKIEGRLKDAGYVKNITAAYRAELDRQLGARGLERASFGESRAAFRPDPKKSFSRLFCEYHLRGIERGCAGFSTPKARGEFIGAPRSAFAGGFEFAGADKIFSNGDGLFFEDENGKGFGARVGRVSGNRVFVGRPEERLKIPPSAKIWRNRDVKFEAALAGKSSRKMRAEICVGESGTDYIFSIGLCDRRALGFEIRRAKSGFETAENFGAAREKLSESLARLGDTPFDCAAPQICCRSLPRIRASEANALRRGLVRGLEEKIISEYEKSRTSYSRPLPRKISFANPPFECDARANAANAGAEKLYAAMGFEISSRAPEAGGDASAIPLMRARHCILRELGMCRKEGKLPQKFKEPLFLRSADGRFPVRFDCVNCQMFVLNPEE